MRYHLYNSVLVFLLVLGGGSLLKQSRSLSLALLVVTFIYICFLILKYRIPIIRYHFKNHLIVLFFFTLIFLLQMLFLPNNLFSNQYFTYYFQFLIIILISYYISVRKLDFQYYLYNIVKLIMYHGLISFFIWFIFKDFAFKISFSKDLATDSIFYLFYYQNTIMSNISEDWKFVDFMGLTFIRNQGIFWEPGVFQIFLNILLYLSLFYYKNMRIAILTTFSLLTTWSTTGLVIMSLQLLVFVFINFKNKVMFFLLPILLVILLVIINITVDNLNEKFSGDKQGSALQRKIDTLSTINIIEKNPLFGIGLDTQNYFNILKKNTISISGGKGSVGVSNSLLYLFLYFGIPLGILFVVSFYKQNLLNKYKVLFFVIIMLSSLTEPVLLLTFYTLFIVNGLQNLIIPRTSIER